MQTPEQIENEKRNADLSRYNDTFLKAEPLTYEQVYDIVHEGKGEYALKTEEFCKEVMKESKRDLVQKLSKEQLSDQPLSQLQIVSFSNLAPTTIEQAKTFVPSVRNANESDLKRIVSIVEAIADEDDEDSFGW